MRLKGRSHGKLGLHRAGKNVYTRKGKSYRRVRGGFEQVRGGGKPRRAPRAPYNPLTPLEGKGFEQEVKAGVGLRYGGQERQLEGERRISGQQSANIGGWYDQYLGELEKARQATQAGYQQATKGVYGQANTAAQQSEQGRQGLQAQDTASAALRGATVGSENEQAAQQAMAARQALSSSFGGMLGTQGASQNAYMAALRSAGAASKVGALGEEAKRRRQVESLARDLQQEKGQYGLDLRSKLRETERKYALERQAFGLDVAKAQESQRTNVARERQTGKTQRLLERDRRHQRMLEDKKYRLDREKYGSAQAKERFLKREGLGPYKRPGKGGGGGGGRGGKGGGLTPSQRRSYRDKWEGYVGDILGGKKAPRGVNPLLSSAAQEYIRNKRKGVSKATARKIKKRFGFHIRVYKSPTGLENRPVKF
jgi:hypothetical protein